MSNIDNVITAIFNPPRNLGGIAVQCTLDESHYDELVITDHPVEQGAAISDHAYKRPVEVVIRAGWSNSGIPSVITNLIEVAALFTPLSEGTEFGANTSPFNYADQVYQQLLTLQATREPFTIVTGKRTYGNMLFKSLHVTTDEKTENALFCTAVCKQVILVSTNVINFPDATALLNPQQNSAVVNTGTQTLRPGTNYNAAAGGEALA
jgi:hypothetical protein